MADEYIQCKKCDTMIKKKDAEENEGLCAKCRADQYLKRGGYKE
jgi:acetyl-CoA carboxylase beta subunit